MRVRMPEQAYEAIKEYCSKGCDFCVFEDGDYCKICNPDLTWEAEEEDDLK